MALTDKNGTPVTVTEKADRFTVTVDGKEAGFAEFAERDGQRVFFHTEVDDAYQGRGLATALIGEALTVTRADGRRVVPVCEMVAGFINKHEDFADITDEVTPEIRRWLDS